MDATEYLQIAIGFTNEREKRWVDEAVIYADPSIYTETPSNAKENINNSKFVEKGMGYFNSKKKMYDSV